MSASISLCDSGKQPVPLLNESAQQVQTTDTSSTPRDNGQFHTNQAPVSPPLTAATTEFLLPKSGEFNSRNTESSPPPETHFLSASPTYPPRLDGDHIYSQENNPSANSSVPSSSLKFTNPPSSSSSSSSRPTKLTRGAVYHMKSSSSATSSIVRHTPHQKSTSVDVLSSKHFMQSSSETLVRSPSLTTDTLPSIPISSQKDDMLQQTAELLQPPLPILSSAVLKDTPNLPGQSEISQSALNEQPTQPTSFSGQLPETTLASSSVSRAPDPISNPISSPVIQIPPRSVKHTSASETILNPRTRSNKPPSLSLTSSTRDGLNSASSPLPPMNGENPIGSVKQVNLLSTVSRSSSAPSTPIPPVSNRTPENFDRSKDRIRIASPLAISHTGTDNYTLDELKVTLSEKLIQLSQVQSQNAQLWTLVNKQRTMIFDLQKDLDGAVEQNERYRGLLAKYQSGSQTSPSQLSGEPSAENLPSADASSSTESSKSKNDLRQDPIYPLASTSTSTLTLTQKPAPHTRSASTGNTNSQKSLDLDSQTSSLESKPNTSEAQLVVEALTQSEARLKPGFKTNTEPELSTNGSEALSSNSLNLTPILSNSPNNSSSHLTQSSTEKNSEAKNHSPLPTPQIPQAGPSTNSPKESFDFSNLNPQRSVISVC